MTHANIDSALRLRRMRQLNLALLAASLLLLACSVYWRASWQGFRWLQAFAEAAAIGAIADWYAVVALFRHPLRIPIPHTAIIPRNQRRIGDSLGQFVTRYLLTPEHIAGRLERVRAAQRTLDWLRAPANALTCARSLCALLPGLLRAPDDADLLRLYRGTILPQLAALNAAGLARRCVELVVGAGLDDPLLDRGLKLVDRWLQDHEELIREKFAAASRYTPAFVDAYLVRKFLEGAHGLIHEVSADPGHPLRGALAAALREWSKELDASAEQRAAAQAWLRTLLETLVGDQDLQRLREALARSIEADLAREQSVLRESLAQFIRALAEGIGRDPAILERLEQGWLRWVRRQAEQHGGQIGALIAEVVGGWNAEEAAHRVELAMGPDLQFIRINGALVGGLAGLVLYAGTVLIGR